MILNDLHDVISLALLVLFMFVFFVCFVFFIYKELGGVKVGRDSFLFFDYMLFSSGWKANLPALAMLLTLAFGNVIDYKREGDVNNVYINIIGVLAMIFLFIHCRFFSGIIYSNQNIKFVKELLLNFNVRPQFIMLWLSRVCYIALIIYIYRR